MLHQLNYQISIDPDKNILCTAIPKSKLVTPVYLYNMMVYSNTDNKVVYLAYKSTYRIPVPGT
jgi:hypothetical protein